MQLAQTLRRGGGLVSQGGARWADEGLLEALLPQQRAGTSRPRGQVVQSGGVRQNWVAQSGGAEQEGGERAPGRPRPAEDRGARAGRGDRVARQDGEVRGGDVIAGEAEWSSSISSRRGGGPVCVQGTGRVIGGGRGMQGRGVGGDSVGGRGEEEEEREGEQREAAAVAGVADVAAGCAARAVGVRRVGRRRPLLLPAHPPFRGWRWWPPS